MVGGQRRCGRLIGGAGIDTAWYTASANGDTDQPGGGHRRGRRRRGRHLERIETSSGPASPMSSSPAPGPTPSTARRRRHGELCPSAGVLRLGSGAGVGGWAEGDDLTTSRTSSARPSPTSCTATPGRQPPSVAAAATMPAQRRGRRGRPASAAPASTRSSTTPRAAGVQVNLAAGTGTGGDAQGDTLTQIENLVGSAFADRLYGDAGVNALNGGAGDDTLRGGVGGDALDGGDGSDFANYQGLGGGDGQPADRRDLRRRRRGRHADRHREPVRVQQCRPADRRQQPQHHRRRAGRRHHRRQWRRRCALRRGRQ